jgi:hypothetical protein
MNCANPQCKAESKYFRSGSLHCIDCGEGTDSRCRGERRRLIWFCRNCSDDWSVETWRPAGQQICRRRRPVYSNCVEMKLAASA